MIDISLKQLEVFVAVAEYNSFTKAAEALYLSQSTVSSHIKNLESALNTVLFCRAAHKKMELSEDGRRIYSIVKEILERCEALQECLDRTDKTPLLTVAASTVPAQYLLPRLLAEFSRKIPDCHFLLKRGDSLRVHEMLSAGEAQVGFVGLKMDERKFAYFPILRDRLVLITANDEPYRSMSPDSGEKLLLSQSVIAREEESGTWQMTTAWLCRRNILPDSLRIVARMETPEAIRRSVAQGMGVSVISSLAAEEDVSAGKLLQFELGEETLWRQIYAVCPRHSKGQPPMVGKFQKFLELWALTHPDESES